MKRLTDFRELREKARISIEEFASRVGYSARTVYRWESDVTQPPRLAIQFLRSLINSDGTSAGPIDPQFTFIDLFAGIGGMRLGFEAARGKCVYTSEWNHYCQKTYAANFACDHRIADDITLIDKRDIPSHDVLLAGFPCQPFSIAGVSKKNALGQPHGFLCKTQGALFFHLAEVVARHRPAAFLLENVKNLQSHDRGKTFTIIMDTLERELGYHVQYRIIDAAGFVPQHRERILIVGFREKVAFDFQRLDIPKPSSRQKLKSILHPEDGSEPPEPPYTIGPKAKVNPKYILTVHLWEYLQNYAAKHKAKGNGFGYGLVGREDIARTLSARYYKDGSEILVRGRPRPRRLTPRECARLMGFDSAGRKRFLIPVSDTQAYKQFGNAVVVPVVETVASGMRPYIMELVNHQPALPFSREEFAVISL